MHYDYYHLWICLVGAVLIGNAVYGIAKKDLAAFIQDGRRSYFQAAVVLRESLFKIAFGLAFIAGGITLLIGSAHA
jgi:hypothetical protein